MRHQVTICARNFFDREGFIEVETPTLVNPTPEGARDYLIPSRVNSGKFYALPQSPQQFKQILMVSGVDRYYQIARCYRDEDLRADRQPEFTQIDMELSFVEPDDIMEIQERFLKTLFKEVLDIDIAIPFLRLPYDEAMARYGSDKPDTRFGFELKDLGDIAAGCGFKVFTGALESGGLVNAINISGGADKFSRKEIDKLQEAIKSYGAKGLAWMKVTEEGVTSPIAKFFDEERKAAILERMEAAPGDLILFVADKKKVVWDSLGFLRREIAGRMGLLDDSEFNFLWVTDFPLLNIMKRTRDIMRCITRLPILRMKISTVWNPIRAGVQAKAYDIVLNGVELGGGRHSVSMTEIFRRGCSKPSVFPKRKPNGNSAL